MSLAIQACLQGPVGSTRSQRQLGPVLEAPQFNLMSRATLARLRGPVVWTSYPGPLALASQCLRGRPAVSGDWGPVPKAIGVDQLSRANRARI